MSGESRSKYLIKNTLIFTLANVGSKLISFFLVPLYTNILSTREYGTIDLIATISAVAGPMLTLNIAESVMRFGLDKDADRDENTRCGSVILIAACIVGGLLIPLCSFLNDVSEYSTYVYFYVISLSASQLYLCDLRGKDLLLLYSIGNVLQTFLIAILNVLFLLVFKLEIRGYLLAYIIANLIVALYAIMVGKGCKSLFPRKIDISKMREMIKYSVVLIPNSFMWWIMNSSDRLMITSMIGNSANGIYAISYKIPTLMSVFTNVFNQAWGYSAIKEEGSIDEEKYNNKVLKLLISFTMLAAIFILAITKPFLSVYVSEEYYIAWKYVPFLIIGSVYMTFGSFFAASYTVHKDSLGFLYSGTFGAIINVIMNFILIPYKGCLGAAIATCLSYIMVFVFRFIHTRKYMKYQIWNKEFIVGSILLFSNTAVMFVDSIWGILLQIIIAIGALLIYAKTLNPLVETFKKRLNLKRG